LYFGDQIENDEIPVYHPDSKQQQFEVYSSENGWVIKGKAIERAAAMTYWEYFASVRRFQRILEAMGIADRLREIGVQEGDSDRCGKGRSAPNSHEGKRQHSEAYPFQTRPSYRVHACSLGKSPCAWPLSLHLTSASSALSRVAL